MASKLRDVLALDKTENAKLREAFIDEGILDTEVDTEKIKERVEIINQQLMICSALAIELGKKETPGVIGIAPLAMALDSSQLIKKARDQSVIGPAAYEWLLKHTHLYNLAKHVIEHEFRDNPPKHWHCRVCPMKLQSQEQLQWHWESKHKIPANMELMEGQKWVAHQADHHREVVGRAEPNGIEVAWIPNGTPLELLQILDDGGHLRGRGHNGHLQVQTPRPFRVKVWIKERNIKHTIKILTEDPLLSDSQESQPPVPPTLKRHHTG